MPMWLAIVLIVVAIVAGLAVGVYLGIQRRKQVAEKAIGSAEAEANRIVSEAIKSAEAKKKEFLLEGKDELHRLRNENEKEISDISSNNSKTESVFAVVSAISCGIKYTEKYLI